MLITVFTGDKAGNEPVARPKRVRNYSPYTSLQKGGKRLHVAKLLSRYEVKFVFTQDVQETDSYRYV